MASIPIVKRLFNSGELSPKVYGRTDIERYEAGLKTMLNIVPIPQGGAVRRPGTRYVASAKYMPGNNNAVKLIPFQFSTTQAYIIEAGNGYMRFYMNGGQIQNNNNAYEISSPFVSSDLNNLQWGQSFDTLYLTNTGYVPRKLTRTAHNNWTLSEISNNNRPSDWNNLSNPSCVTFYQDRLVYAASTLHPSRMWFSKTSNYEDFTTGTNDADAFTINLLSGTSDVISWMVSHRSLITGADSGVWSVSAANGANSAITPTNRRAEKDSYFGSSRTMPSVLGDHVIYSQYLNSKVRDLAYSYEADGYTSSEASVLADHVIEGYAVRELAYQQSPFEIVWMRRNDGRLLALTYLAEHKVIGWSQHTCGNVLSIACIPGNNETELWIATSRTVNNNNVTYIELMQPFYFSGMNNAFFVDCGLSGNAASNNVGGLSHLANMSVSYLADGICGNATVANNAITISTNGANNIVVGLPYASELETLPIEAEIKSGPTMFKTKRVTEMAVRCRNSAGGTYGPDSVTQTSLLNNNSLFSGDKTNLSVRGGHGTQKTVMIRQTEPFPLNIDAIGLEVEIE
jgi:hypothetical protein